MNRDLDERISVMLNKVMALRRGPEAERNTRKSLLVEMVFVLSDLLAGKCNQPFTSCGTEHLAAERALAIIERHGLPNSDQAWEHLTFLTDKAGQGFNVRAIGAVAHHRDGWITDRFYTIVSRASCVSAGLHESEETLEWWSRQPDAAREVLSLASTEEVPSLAEALTALNAFVARQHQPEIYGNGSDFDNAILAAAAHAVGMKLAWPFWMNRCYRTLKARSSVKIERSGVHHNALDDAVSQAQHLGAIESDLAWDSCRIHAAVQFTAWMADRYRRRTAIRVFGIRIATLSRATALELARSTFDAMSQDTAAFGTPDHDWTREGANSVVDEELRHWND